MTNPARRRGSLAGCRPFSRRTRRLSSYESGQALVEFALVLPVFMLLILGIIAVGNFYGKRQTLVNAAGAAARFESICNGATTGDATAVGQASTPNITPAPTFTYYLQGTSTAEPHAAGCTIPSGTAITVTASAPSVIVSFVGLTLTLPLTTTLTVVEQ
jgi:Flp pilus assembly protein TadG